MTTNEQQLKGMNRSRSTGAPPSIPRSSPPRNRYDEDFTPRMNNASTLPPYPTTGNSSNMSSNQRLRAVSSFSPYNPPSTMAVRLSAGCAGGSGRSSGGGGGGGGGGPSLAAIAGPMGITIIDIMTPHRPWLVLNYSSSVDGDGSGSYSGNDAIVLAASGAASSAGGEGRRDNGGINTMAFQPCRSISQYSHSSTDGGKNNPHAQNAISSSSILLATARGSGILIWDCSGRALSPLLGRLNAADSGGVVSSGGVASQSNKIAKKEQINRDAGSSKQSVIDEGKQIDLPVGSGVPPLLPSSKDLTTKVNSTTGVTLDTVQPLSLSTVSGGASTVTNSTTSTTISSTLLSAGINSSATSSSKNASKSNSTSSKPSSVHGVVKSLAWKGPSAPILLSTCGNTACLWDLRSGIQHARPCSRFVAPADLLTANGRIYGGSDLIHCAWSYDENQNQFATMDSLGIVTIWDERKNAKPISRFLAHEGGGVGVSSIPPSKESIESGGKVEERWVTWGVDNNDRDDLIVKVYTKSSSRPSKYNSNESVKNDTSGYTVTSKISMSGGVAARVHPCYSDGVLLFRSPALSSPPTLDPNNIPPIYTPTDAARFIDLPINIPSPNRRSSVPGPSTDTVDAIVSPTLSPALIASSSPPSPPSLAIQDVDEVIEESRLNGEEELMYEKGGWQAELWRFDAPHDKENDKEQLKIGHDGGDFGAEKIASFHGGGADEDILCIAPGQAGNTRKVISVDLAVGSMGQDKMANNRLSIGPKQASANTDTNNAELSMCCLTDVGRFSLYGIPEANVLVNSESIESVPHRTKPTVEMEAKQSALANAFSSHSASTKLYRQGKQRLSSWWDESEDNVFGEDKHVRPSPIKRSQTGETDERGDTQFDIDLSTSNLFEGEDTAGMPGRTSEIEAIEKPIERTDSDGGVVVGNPSLDSAGDDVQNIPIQNVPIDLKKAARVLCPPLCGALFSAGGAGGLVKFDNGPVKKMWSWYESNQIASPTSPFNRYRGVELSGDEDDEEKNEGGSATVKKSGMPGDQNFPRTLFELIEMSSAAKIHQWGEENNDSNTGDVSNDDSSSSSESDGSSEVDSRGFYPEQSDGTSGSDDDSYYHVRKRSTSDGSGSFESAMFDDYFASARGSLLGPPAGTNDADSKPGVRRARSYPELAHEFAGLPSLSPNVLVTKEYDDITLNGQSPELAQMLELGDCWWLAKDFSVPDSNWHSNEKPANSWSEWDDNNVVQRNTSDPYLSTRSDKNSRDRSCSYDDTSSKQLTMMGNLKKLFSYQIPGVTMTPPDQRLINSKNKARELTDDVEENFDASSNSASGSGNFSLGVYALSNRQVPTSASERLVITRNLCMKNSSICSDFGQKSKADTWALLAQAVEAIGTFDCDEYDGWGGEEDAITTGVVNSILRYYEHKGDYQMLCTILCVLTFGRDRRKFRRGHDSSALYEILPRFDDRRYDNYISRYATLLYSWGILTVRSEISKRLAFGIPGGGAEIVMHLDEPFPTSPFGNTTPTLLPNPGVAPGLHFAPICRQCMEPVVDTDICQRCKDYAFQCSICCSAVRGLCTWCPLCGHGGHVDHIMPWFQRYKVCPTGCGCVCIISS